MKSNFFNLFFCFAFLISCSEEQLDDSGKGIVKGRVVDSGTFEPISNARLSSSPATSTFFSDKDGYFTFDEILIGDYSFKAEKEGYITKFEPVKVTKDNTTQVIFELEISTANNKPPDIPVLTSPVDKVSNQPLTVNTTWTAVDKEADPLTYTVTLRNATTDAVVTYSDIKTTSFQLTGLSYSTKYFWQVSVSDGINKPVNSVTNSFTTIPFPDPRFLFVKKSNNNNVIYTGDESGNELQLTSNTVNCYRPRKNLQAKKIAFISSDGSQNQIYTMNIDGSGIQKVTNSIPIAGFNMEHVSYSWNTNGSQLIYPNFDKLYKINADGSGLSQIFQTPNGKFISECVWSNDSNSIVLKVNNNIGYEVEIYVISMAGVVQYTVLSGISGATSGLDISIENKKIVYTRDVSGFQNLEYRRLDSRIFSFDTESKVSTEVATNKTAGFNDLDVKFSPNQGELIFVNTSNDGISQRNIQKINFTNSDSRSTLFSGAFMPDWK